MYNLKGELYLHKNVSNLDYLLQNATENISKVGIRQINGHPNAGKIVGTQTTWMIQNMICRNHVAEYYSARNEDNIVCLAPGVLYLEMCQKDVKSLWFKSLV